jgi:hypothetical protein
VFLCSLHNTRVQLSLKANVQTTLLESSRGFLTCITEFRKVCQQRLCRDSSCKHPQEDQSKQHQARVFQPQRSCIMATRQSNIKQGCFSPSAHASWRPITQGGEAETPLPEGFSAPRVLLSHLPGWTGADMLLPDSMPSSMFRAVSNFAAIVRVCSRCLCCRNHQTRTSLSRNSFIARCTKRDMIQFMCTDESIRERFVCMWTLVLSHSHSDKLMVGPQVSVQACST